MVNEYGHYLYFVQKKSFIVGEDFSDTKNRSFKLIGSWWPVSMAVVQKKSIQNRSDFLREK
jgi:predicted NAD-dependent protein-ADP-ribosyltransferase YbiA (DUF1768 family)